MGVAHLLLVRWLVQMGLLRLLNRRNINNLLVPITLNVVCRLSLNVVFWWEIKIPTHCRHRLTQTKKTQKGAGDHPPGPLAPGPHLEADLPAKFAG
jgi:hypothetical protein